MRSVNTFNDGFGDPQGTVSATAARRGFDDQDARLMLEEAPDGVLTEAPHPCHLSDGEVLFARRRVGRHVEDGLGW